MNATQMGTQVRGDLGTVMPTQHDLVRMSELEPVEDGRVSAIRARVRALDLERAGLVAAARELGGEV